jgi:hypothetical protein
MKMNKLITTAALALASAALLGSLANAANPEATGDLILGFQTASPNSGFTIDLETNLGLYSNFTGLADGTTVNLTDGLTTAGQTGAFDITDLNTTYSSPSGATLKFSVSGTTDVNSEIFISNGAGATPSQHPTQPEAAQINSMLNTFGSGTAGAGTDALVSTATAGSYQKIAGTAGTYSIEASSTQSTYATGSAVVFDLYDQPITSSGNPVSEVGYFTLYGATDTASGKAGQLTFTSTEVQAVPEPSTYALFGLGALVMVIAVRRRGVLQS